MANFGIEVPHNVSTKLLSQLSGGFVDQYTNHVASIIFKDLKLGPQGQRRVNSAFTNLPIFFTPDEKLTFGWGLDSIVRNSEVHKDGWEHAAIMIALAESLHSSWAAEVCHEMAKSMAGPTDSLPHLSQWQAVLQSCTGAFASIDFGVTVEDFVRLDPYNLNIGVNSDRHLILPVKDLVAALRALAAVVKGTEEEVVMEGSAILGWFAAVAEVLYDLNVEVFSSEGDSLSLTKAGEKPQVRIIWREKRGIEILSRTRPPMITHTLSNSNLNSQQYSGGVHTTPFGGRVVWQSLLPRVFGASFSHLDHEHSKLLSGMIGAGARMFQGLALGESAEEDLVSAQNKSNPASYGAGLVQTLTAWLPELRRFQGRMERALKLDYHTAADAYVENITKLREACHCGICFSKPGDEDEGRGPGHGYCLVVIVESIIAMGLALSRITVAAQIYPARAGVQRLYGEQVSKRLEARGRRWQEHFTHRVCQRVERGTASTTANRCCSIFRIFADERSAPESHCADPRRYCRVFSEAGKVNAEERGRSDHPCQQWTYQHEAEALQTCMHGPVLDTGVDDLWEAVEIEHLAVTLYCK